MKNFTSLVLFSCCLLSTPATGSAATLTIIGDLSGGDSSSGAHGVSADGKTVIGQSSSSAGYQAIRWTQATGTVGLGDLSGGAYSSRSNGVSADGSVIVGYGNTSAGSQAFRWTSSTGMVGLGDLPGGSSVSSAENISADGSTIVGFGSSSSGTEAMRRTSSGMAGLGDFSGGSFNSRAYDVSSDGSVIVGYGFVSSGYRAFRWTSGTGLVNLGAGRAFGVSGDGNTVVGQSTTGDAFRWTSSTGMQNLDPSGNFDFSEAYATSEDGSVTAGMAGAGSYKGFMHTEVLGTILVEDFITDQLGLSLSSWTSFGIARDVSASGRVIVGSGSISSSSPRGWRLEFESLPIAWTNNSSADWDDASNWTYGLKAGAAGQDDVSITPSNGLTVTGPASATTVDSLTIGASFSGVARLDLQSDFSANDSVTILDQGEINLAGYTLDTGTSGLDLQTGGKIAGVGDLVGDLTSNGELSPGNSPGEMAIDGNLELAGGSYLFEINDAQGTAGENTGWDLISVTGNTQITATSGDPILLELTSLAGLSAGETANFDPAADYTWEVLTSGGGITGFTASAFLLDTTSFQNDLAGGSLSLIQAGNSLVLQFTALPPVPEPGTGWLLLIGYLLLQLRCKKSNAIL